MATTRAGKKLSRGNHSHSAVLTKLFELENIINPVSNEHFSEAMIFGMAGGISCGYQLCPSIFKHKIASGINMIGRYKLYDTAGNYQKGVCDRLGISYETHESASKKAPEKHVVSVTEQGKPALAWCDQGRLPYMVIDKKYNGYIMTSILIAQINPETNTAVVYDCPSQPFTLSLEDLANTRNGICSHKNRSLFIKSTAKISKSKLKTAIQSAISLCLNDMIYKPKMKSFSIHSLEDWRKKITNSSNAQGWGKLYTEGYRYWALRDTYHEIETNGTGGGLFRNLYAQFLSESGEYLNNKKLSACAEVYHSLAKKWTKLADKILPNDVPEFKETKKLLKKSRKDFESKGPKSESHIQSSCDDLNKIEKSLLKKFPWNEQQSNEHAESLIPMIESLHEQELQAAEQLKAAI